MIQHFIEHYSGEGSLVRNLQNHALALNVRTTVERTYSHGLFYILIELTEEGVKKSSDIIKAIYAFISMLKATKKACFKAYWRNHIKVKQLNFDYMLNTDSFDYVK